MTHNNKNYNLTINNKSPLGGTGTTINASSNMPEDLMRLLQLSGQGSNTVYSLSVSDQAQHSDNNIQMTSTSNTNVSSANAGDVMQVLAQDMEDCGCESEEFAIMEQQAEYDYGHKDPTEEGHEFDLKDYNFKGRADLPERLTSARYGSNALKSEMRESAFRKLKQQYQRYLEEARENEAGLSSPLTASDRDEFDHDPQAGDPEVIDGSHSPLSTIVRQKLPN